MPYIPESGWVISVIEFTVVVMVCYNKEREGGREREREREREGVGSEERHIEKKK